jgi:hypothetical protein
MATAISGQVEAIAFWMRRGKQAIANCLSLAAAKVLCFSSIDKTPLTVNRRG